jgi:hypothetical protein
VNTYPFAGEIKMEKVIKDGKEVIEWEGIDLTQTTTTYTFTPPGKEWARIDKDMNVVHLDMELCAKGPHNAYTALALAIWNKAIAQEREACAKVCEDRERANLYGVKECAAAIRARGNT